MIKLKPLILKENIPLIPQLASIVQFVVTAGLWYAIKLTIYAFKKYKDYRMELYPIWLGKLEKNNSFQKFVYYTIKNDKILSDFEKKLKDKNKSTEEKKQIKIEKINYTKNLVEKILSSNPAQEELLKAIKEKYPNSINNKETIKMLQKQTLKETIPLFLEKLNSNDTKTYLNKIAKSKGLEPV